MKDTILVIGAMGQLGTELTVALKCQYGDDWVIGTDLRGPNSLDVLDKAAVSELVVQRRVTQIYLLAAMLSATGEQQPQAAWHLNVQGLLNVLEVACEHDVAKVFWPSSIAVFGPGSPKTNCPQETVMAPTTIYGISKLTGERWCAYYRDKRGLDVRSLRYPGLISATAAPGGGTTDYAVDIFQAAARSGPFTCFLRPDTRLPMMYMRDAVRATLELMDAPAAALSVRTAYNISAMHFTPAELAAEIRQHIPGFSIDYAVDHRQAIADSWPQSINDAVARKEWGWAHGFDLAAMTREMLRQVMPLRLQPS